MGASTAQTVKEIEAVRHRLDEEVRELEQRLPAVARGAKKMAGVVAGGGLAASALLFALKRASRTKKHRQAGFAVPKGSTVVQVMPVRVPDELASALKDGRWRPYAVAAGGAWLGVQAARLAVAFRATR